MNSQQPHSVINSMAGSNQRGVASSQQMYQMQQSNMSQMSHLQQQQQQQQHHPQPQQQSHMMSSYSTQKPSDMSSRQYSPSMSTLNGSAYQPLTGPNLHSGLNMDSNQMGLHQHNEAPSHQYNQQQQQHHHQYPTSLQQQQQQQPHQQQQQQQHQSYQPNVPSQQHQQQLQNQKQMPSHMMQQSHQYNMHQGNPAQQQQQQAPSQHSQMKPTHQHHQQQQPQQRQQQQPYVHVQQRNMHQHQQQQQQPKYDRIQQPRRILQNTNSLNHRPNHRPGVISRDSAMAKDPVVLVTESGVGAGDSAAVKEIEGSKDNDITEEQNSEQNITDKSDSASENTELANTKEKTPMTLVQELARFNKIEIKYTLLDEQGPAHKKTFFVKLLLGTEEYSSSGASIRKAQAAAAVMAMKETKYKSPPERKAWRAKRDLTLTEDGKLTPTVELNGLAMKRGESANYKAIEPQQPPYYYPPGMDPRAMYSPRYYHYLRASRDPRFARGYWPMRYHYPRMSRAFYVSLRVGHREFIGDGPTRQAARHNAAIKALKVLKNLPAKEKVEEPEPVVEETKDDDDDDDDEEDDDLKSRVTSVHEIAFRRKLSVNFEVIRESGPPHMKTFVTRCTVGDMVTEGEGNSKKTSKKIAAEQMYEKFKELTPLPASAVQRKPRTQVYKKKRGIGIKADIQQQKADPNYGSGVNPISRLIQIMCAQKKKEPVYSLVAETGVSCRKEFIMQIEVLDKTCTGSGPNKKLAKRAAAEAMLELLGYNKPTPQPAKSSFKQQHSMEGNGEKKVTFSEYEKGPTEKGNHQKVPGLLHLPSKTIVSVPPAAPGSSAGPPTSSSNFNSKESLVNLSSILKPNWRPELQLRELCKALNYPLEINDITKGQANKSVEYVSRIHVGTNDNRQNFLGSSNSFESARDMACMEALKVLVSRVKDMHPAGDGSAHMKKSVLSRASSGARGGVSQ